MEKNQNDNNLFGIKDIGEKWSRLSIPNVFLKQLKIAVVGVGEKSE
ncbi:hypothetical protein [Brochothrix thermosphacta]